LLTPELLGVLLGRRRLLLLRLLLLLLLEARPRPRGWAAKSKLLRGPKAAG
jgi:hypothetical protein